MYVSILHFFSSTMMLTNQHQMLAFKIKKGKKRVGAVEGWYMVGAGYRRSFSSN
jgi:hypothetical protein